MTTITLPGRPVPCEVTAEQGVAYLLRDGSGWREIIWNGSRRFVHDGAQISIALSRVLDLTIEDIARAENRHPIDVATDIAGPAVGVGGVGTNDAIPIEEQWSCGECEFSPPRECAGTSPTPGEVYWAEAPSAPEVE